MENHCHKVGRIYDVLAGIPRIYVAFIDGFGGLRNQGDNFQWSISRPPDVGICFDFFLNSSIFVRECEYGTVYVLRALRKKP